MTAPADRTAPADPTGATAVDPAAFRAAMARHAAGVVVVTTWDAEGRGRGFTATSFCSVSADPPLILVCLAETAGSFAAFSRCTEFAVSMLHTGHTAVATRFATSGADKFRDHDTVLTDGLLPAVAGAPYILDCRVQDRHRAGDHLILVAAVTAVGDGGTRHTGDHGDGGGADEGGDSAGPLLYYDRAFRRLQRE
ncbi:flavin reductase family protein [Streptomyces xiamenensis]